MSNGFNLSEAAELGGGDTLWTTTSQSDAGWFAASNPAEGEGATVGIRVPNSVIDNLSGSGQLNINGPVYRFEPGGVDALNAHAQTWIVP